MNDVQGNQPRLETVSRADPVSAQAAPAPRVRVRPLLALVPYVMRYRAQAAAALVALLVAAAATLAVIPVVGWLMRDDPRDVGVRPYGETGPVDAALAKSTVNPARRALQVLGEAARTRDFWLLAGSFFVCGASTNGLIGTHFIPAAHDHGMPETTSASLLALIGVFDIVGTVASGWLTDRVDSRYLLFFYYFFRGLSLLAVPALLAPTIHPSLFVFILFYGLDWVATVPPTVALCRAHFGIERSGIVFGWVFAAHMVGAGVAASFAGWIRETQGDYFDAWMTAGGLCLMAAVVCLLIPRTRPA